MEEVDAGFHLKPIKANEKEMSLCIHVRKTKWDFSLIQKLKAAWLYYSLRN